MISHEVVLWIIRGWFLLSIIAVYKQAEIMSHILRTTERPIGEPTTWDMMRLQASGFKLVAASLMAIASWWAVIIPFWGM